MANQRVYTITWCPDFGVDCLRIICTDIWKLETYLEYMLNPHIWDDTKSLLENIDEVETIEIQLPSGSYSVRALECDTVIDIHL